MHFNCLDESYAMVKSNLYFDKISLTGLTGTLSLANSGGQQKTTTGPHVMCEKPSHRDPTPTGTDSGVAFASKSWAHALICSFKLVVYEGASSLSLRFYWCALKV